MEFPRLTLFLSTLGFEPIPRHIITATEDVEAWCLNICKGAAEVLNLETKSPSASGLTTPPIVYSHLHSGLFKTAPESKIRSACRLGNARPHYSRPRDSRHNLYLSDLGAIQASRSPSRSPCRTPHTLSTYPIPTAHSVRRHASRTPNLTQPKSSRRSPPPTTPSSTRPSASTPRPLVHKRASRPILLARSPEMRTSRQGVRVSSNAHSFASEQRGFSGAGKVEAGEMAGGGKGREGERCRAR